jgi:Ca2+-binding RTX toxin-like protein
MTQPAEITRDNPIISALKTVGGVSLILDGWLELANHSSTLRALLNQPANVVVQTGKVCKFENGTVYVGSDLFGDFDENGAINANDHAVSIALLAHELAHNAYAVSGSSVTVAQVADPVSYANFALQDEANSVAHERLVSDELAPFGVSPALFKFSDSSDPAVKTGPVSTDPQSPFMQSAAAFMATVAPGNDDGQRLTYRQRYVYGWIQEHLPSYVGNRPYAELPYQENLASKAWSLKLERTISSDYTLANARRVTVFNGTSTGFTESRFIEASGGATISVTDDEGEGVVLAGLRLTGGVESARAIIAEGLGRVGYRFEDSATGAVYKYFSPGFGGGEGRLEVSVNGNSLTIVGFDPKSASQDFGLNLQFGSALEEWGDTARHGATHIANALRSAMGLAATTAVFWRDPLLLDLNGDGQLATLREGQGAHFDFDGNGFAESTGWAGPSDGLVVRDLDGNGRIESGRELFGDQTLLPNGALATNGFQAIASLDTNSDGQVNSQDAAWSQLLVWRDADGDGVTDSGELLTMAEAGVSGVSTTYTSPNQTDANGNRIAQAGAFTRVDGTTGKAGSLLFDRDTMDTLPTDTVDISDAVSRLPDLGAFGSVYSLHQAMARNSTLASVVSALVVSTDYKTLRAQFDALVQQWTGALSISPTSRGSNIDARQLAVLEAFYGQGFVGTDGANPNANAAPVLKDAYLKLVDELYSQFLAQAQLKPIWDNVEFDWDGATGVVETDFVAAVPAMQSLLGQQPSTAVQLLYEFAKSAKQFGLDASSGFASFKAAFDGSPFGYDKVLQAGLDGLALVIGTDASESLSLTSRGVLLTLNGGGTATGSSASDSVYGGNGNDALNGGDGDDLLAGGEGNDTLDGGRGADTLRGGAGDDTLGGAAGSYDAGSYSYGYVTPVGGNTYEGGSGNDMLRGTSMADLYLFNLGDGADTIYEVEVGGQPVAQLDVLRFGAGIGPSDITVGRNGADLLLTHVNGSDRVTIKNWFTNPGQTANQIERVEFADGTSWTNIDLSARALVVNGTAGNDTLSGLNAFNDTLLGGAGNDSLSGGDGDDVVDGGEGNDTLDGGRGADTLRGGAGDDILGGAAGSYDAGSYSYGYVSPVAGNVYEGGAGNDTLRGTSMADLYLFNLGDGADTLYEVEVSGQPAGQVDVLRFGAGIAPSDILVSRSGTDLVLAHVNGIDKVTIKSWYTNAGSVANQVERVEFADGTSWSNIDLTAQALVVTGTAGNDSITGVSNYVNTIYAGAGSDTVYGGTGNDVLFGEDGNDTLNAGDGNDVLEGGDGNDTLDGGRGADILRGGAGDDTLGGAAGSYDAGAYSYGFVSPVAGNTYEGGAGNDTLRGTSMADLYLFNLGDGADTLYEVEVGGQPVGQVDVLRFGAGIAPTDISVGRNGADLLLTHVNGADRLTIKNWFTYPGQTTNQVERIEFADGTSWSNIDLTAQALVVSGTSGNDTLYGVGTFNDTLLGGAGNDSLNGSDGDDVLEGGEGNDTLDGGRGADILRGGAGDDILGGSGGSPDSGYYSYGFVTPGAGNSYEGGAGNDTLRGTSLADSYLFTLGDGADTIYEVEVTGQPTGQVDVLRFGPGIAAGDMAVSRSGSDLVLAHANGTDKVTIKNWYTTAGSVQNQVERVEFADGTVWLSSSLTAQALVVTGTSGNDTLNGVSNYSSTINAGAGNDTVTGGSGADLLRGDGGNDSLNGGDDADVLEGGEGNDTLDGGRGADTLRGGAGDDILGGAGGSYDAGSYNYGYVSPLGGNTYEGGTGNDTLRGTSMADLYLFNLGDGADTLYEVEVGGQPAAQVDVLRFGPGIGPSDIAVSRSGIDLILAHSNGTDSVTVKNWYTNPGAVANQVERIEFADGTSWSNIDLTALALVVTGTAGNDNLYGVGTFNDTLRGGSGNDSLYGQDGNDVLEGGDGNDTLDGGRGADVLNGGAGDDILGGSGGGLDTGYYNYGYISPLAGNTYQGGTGNDTLRGTSMADLYLFNLGDGQDSLYEIEVTGQPSAQVDVLRFGAGIVPSDITVTRVGADLVLAHSNGSDKVLVKNWYSPTATSTANQLERVEFADGTLWTGAYLTNVGATSTGSSGADVLNGSTSYLNVLYGMAGNDTLNGGASSDTLYGGEGTDLLQGGAGDDDYRYLLGDGNDTVNDSSGAADALRMDGLDMSAVHYWKQGNDLCIEVAEGQSMLVKNHFLSGGANKVESFYLNGMLMSSNDMAILAQPRP